MMALSHRRRQKGAVLVLVTIALFALLAITALALDGGYIVLNKTRVQDAVDSAALSGAKTLEQGGSHSEATDSVITTLQRIFSGDGFNNINMDLDNLSDSVIVEFSLEPVPFSNIGDPAAGYIRVRLEQVPVTQFFSQLLLDIWQVRASAVAGASAVLEEPCQLIPLMMCLNDPNPPEPLPDNYDFGYQLSDGDQRGDVVVIKSPNHQSTSSVGPGNFLAFDLGTGNSGADKYRDGLAGALNDASCVAPGEVVKTKTGNMVGPTSDGLNTRFGDYKGSMKEPTADPYQGGSSAYYADCEVPTFTPIDFSKDDFVKAEESGSYKLPEGSSYLNSLQSYADYNSQNSQYSKPPSINNPEYCVPRRRVVTVPVVDCSGVSNGTKPITVVGNACMFLSQKVTGQGNDQFIVAEFLKNCESDGTTYGNKLFGPDRIVLYKDSGSGDS